MRTTEQDQSGPCRTTVNPKTVMIAMDAMSSDDRDRDRDTTCRLDYTKRKAALTVYNSSQRIMDNSRLHFMNPEKKKSRREYMYINIKSLSRMMRSSLHDWTSHPPSIWLLLYSAHKLGGAFANTVAHTHDETQYI